MILPFGAHFLNTLKLTTIVSTMLFDLRIYHTTNFLCRNPKRNQWKMHNGFVSNKFQLLAESGSSRSTIEIYLIRVVHGRRPFIPFSFPDFIWMFFFYLSVRNPIRLVGFGYFLVRKLCGFCLSIPTLNKVHKQIAWKVRSLKQFYGFRFNDSVLDVQNMCNNVDWNKCRPIRHKICSAVFRGEEKKDLLF